MPRLTFACAFWLLVPAVLTAAAPPLPVPPRTVEELAKLARPSVVVVSIHGRDGKRAGLGAGFVVGDGLVATNHHVIGEGRRIVIETADGKSYEAASVHATDRGNDLALIRIDAKGLIPLRLGDDAKLVDGQAVVAMGNPRGLKHSVVDGVVSGKRQLDGRPMIQVAIPIEPGNSGGPLLDRRGRVVGIMTSKSLVTANLGFAVGVRSLKPLLLKPNPVPMKAWLTIGALDADDWQVKGGRWRQRAGRIIGEGVGAGFGGRALCLAARTVPELPFEVAVSVRLGDESGAAGLAFHCTSSARAAHEHGGDRHYGFYPSNGKLRLTRFNGPDVFSWKVLQEKSHPAYRAGEWNTLKVRLEKGRIKCLVNDQQVFDVAEDEFTSGKVGLARFRETVAEFKQFRIGKNLPAQPSAAGLMPEISKSLKGAPLTGAIRPELLKKMPAGKPATLAALREQARLLEQQAEQLRRLALALHQAEVHKELAALLKAKGDDFDLVHAALLIARLDNDELDVDAYRAEVDRLARKAAALLPKGASEKQKLATLDRFLFQDKGFHGSRSDYYNRSNSYLSEVIDDREGLPITLSVLYMELARRLSVKVEGVGLPGHFIVRHVPRKGATQLIDPYSAAARMSRADAEKKVLEMTGEPLVEEDLAAVPKRLILVRMLRNLLNVASGQRDVPGMLRYIDTILVLQPRSGPDRGRRIALRYQAGDLEGALDDVEWILENKPDGIDLDKVEEMRRFLKEKVRDK